MKIAIDPGHGGHDPGAVGNGLKEKDITLDIALEVAKLLRAAGQTVLLTRETDRFIDLTAERTPNADISVSIHVNAGGGVGLETWFSLFRQPAESRRLGQAIQDGILRRMPFPNRGLKTRTNSSGTADYLYMLRKPRGVAVLVEVGFIDSQQDVNQLRTKAGRTRIAEGIAEGILDYLGLEVAPVSEQWKLDIISKAKAAGLITSDHDPDEPASKWFVLQVIMNALKGGK